MEIESGIPSPPLGERGRGEGDAARIAGVATKHPALHPHYPLTLYPSPPVGERDLRVAEIARSWIGTPYVHQASLKGVGCDCLGLLRGIWRELHGEEAEAIPPYSPDWAEATGAETLYMALERHCSEVPPAQLAPGDVALFRMAPRGPAKHCGIVASMSPRPLGGRGVGVRGNRIQETENPGVGQFPRNPRDPFFVSPLTLNPSPPRRGGEGHSFTLIHARANKRVSEEPLSPYWRDKLAYAFRLVGMP